MMMLHALRTARIPVVTASRIAVARPLAAAVAAPIAAATRHLSSRAPRYRRDNDSRYYTDPEDPRARPPSNVYQRHHEQRGHPESPDPRAVEQRLLMHCRKRRTRSAWTDYEWLSAHAPEYVTSDVCLALFNALRQRQASRGDVVHMISLLDRLAGLEGGAAPPMPLLELTLVRAAQCKMVSETRGLWDVVQEAAKAPGAEPVRLPVFAAVLNAYKKTRRFEEALDVAQSFRDQPVIQAHPWVLHRILIEIHSSLALDRKARGDPADPDGSLGLAAARALFEEFVANETQPAALAKAYSTMALAELAHGHADAAQAVLDRLDARGVPLTPSCHHVHVQLAIHRNDLAAARAHLAHEMRLSQKPLFSMSAEAVMDALLRAGDERGALETLAAYTDRCAEFLGFARVKYSPYAVLIRHWAAEAGGNRSGKKRTRGELVQRIEDLFATIPGTPFLHDYAVEMMVRAFVDAKQTDRIVPFVMSCLERGYEPGPTGWTEARARETAEKGELVPPPSRAAAARD
ncbi:phosphatidylinositol-binding protein scs2 [Blastocladiella emersonii ATCC 22665]|nr:phosphatidylinositol-binding protein scs2 [Blastocladiella emersonii ATCC 22665]